MLKVENFKVKVFKNVTAKEEHLKKFKNLIIIKHVTNILKS